MALVVENKVSLFGLNSTVMDRRKKSHVKKVYHISDQWLKGHWNEPKVKEVSWDPNFPVIKQSWPEFVL